MPFIPLQRGVTCLPSLCIQKCHVMLPSHQCSIDNCDKRYYFRILFNQKGRDRNRDVGPFLYINQKNMCTFMKLYLDDGEFFSFTLIKEIEAFSLTGNSANGRSWPNIPRSLYTTFTRHTTMIICISIHKSQFCQHMIPSICWKSTGNKRLIFVVI